MSAFTVDLYVHVCMCVCVCFSQVRGGKKEGLNDGDSS